MGRVFSTIVPECRVRLETPLCECKSCVHRWRTLGKSESLPVCQIRQVYLNGFPRGQETRAIFLEPTLSQSFASVGTGCPWQVLVSRSLTPMLASSEPAFLLSWADTKYGSLSLRFALLWGPLALLGSHNWCITRDLDSHVGSGHMPFCLV